jgi:hypothetical protein
MNSFTRTMLLPLIAGAIFTSAHAAPMTNSSADYGQIVAASTVDKEVKIGAATRYVNVVNGQTVQFEVGDQSFSFSFDAWPGDRSVDLALIAPKGMVVPHVRVYVTPDRRYLG